MKNEDPYANVKQKIDAIKAEKVTVAVEEDAITMDEANMHIELLKTKSKNDISEIVSKMEDMDLDPRPNEDDHYLWRKLLPLAGRFSKRMRLNLWSLRAIGTRLQRVPGNPAMPYKLIPILKKDCWADEETFKAIAGMCFTPQIELLKKIFQRL